MLARRITMLATAVAAVATLTGCTTDGSPDGGSTEPSDLPTQADDGGPASASADEMCAAVAVGQATVVPGIAVTEAVDGEGEVSCQAAAASTYAMGTTIEYDPDVWATYRDDTAMGDLGMFAGEPGRMSAFAGSIAFRTGSGWTVVLTELANDSSPTRLAAMAEATLVALEPFAPAG